MAQNLLNIRLPETHIPALDGWHEKGLSILKKTGLPTHKTEAWKYTPLHILSQNIYASVPACVHEHHDDCTCNNLAILPFDAYEIHFHNGHLCHHHSHLPDGCEIMSLEQAATEHETADYLNKTFEIKDFPFAAFNTAHLSQGIFLRISKNVIPDKPIAFVYHQDTDLPIINNLRNIIILENGAKLEWCEVYDGKKNQVYFDNIVNEIFLSRKSVLKHYKSQTESPDAAHICLNAVKVKADARFESFCRQNGGALSRHETFAALKEAGASALVNVVYTAENNSIIDTTTNIAHLAPETHSDQLVKGIIDNQGKGVFQGKIHIAQEAVKAEGYQLHKALLLSEEAEVDVKPELEIYTDDVKCSHGAASGELDEEQLFYMQARGIERCEAERLLIQAFLDEAFEKIENADIRNWLQNKIF